MRLWHVDLLQCLPKSQLISQWRELNSIYRKEDKHILINYIYDYHLDVLLNYSLAVIGEILVNGYKINKFDNFDKYFQLNLRFILQDISIFELRKKGFKKPFKEHNDRYLLQCFYNLQEKYDRGQKDFDNTTYENLVEFMRSRGFEVQ